MTQEEKAKRYNEAIERAKKCLKDGTITDIAISYIETIFPELKESEDEKIRKVLVGWVNIEPLSSFEGGFTKEDILAWLEKQKEQKPVEWSEEDEDKIMLIEDSFSDYLDYIREDNSLTKHQKNTTKDNVVGYVNWLKSLRLQKQWKPSDEQMEALETINEV